MHELAHYAVLVFLDEENELSFVLWARNGCIWPDSRIIFPVERAPSVPSDARKTTSEVTGESAAPLSGSSKMNR